MVRSFKLKLVLLSVLVSGLILLAFGAFSLSVIRRIGLERIDRELLALGDAQVRRPQPPEHWARFDESLASIHGTERSGQFVVKAVDRHGGPLYVSPRWPDGLTAQGLEVLDIAGEEPARRPPPGERGFPPVPPMPREGGSGPRPPPGLEGPELRGGPPRPMRVRAPRYMLVTADQRAWRFIVMGNEEITLMIGMDLAAFHAEVQRYRNTFAVAAPIALLLLAAGGWLLAAQALRPVRVLTQVATGITAKGLDQRVPAANADREFQALIDVINGMLGRLEKSFQQAVRFSADAAHELKTPLTILQGQLEQAVQIAPSESREQRTYADLLEEVQRLKVIVRKLLLLAQADSGQLKLSLERVDLSREVEALCEDARTLAPELMVQSDIAAGVGVMADPDLVRQALQNLVSNAIKHNREGGCIEFRLSASGGRAGFTIANSTEPGTRIDRDRIFERFYRADKARGRQVAGVGLGLSLAREVARAHGGDLVLQDLRDGWIAFELILPAC